MIYIYSILSVLNKQDTTAEFIPLDALFQTDKRLIDLLSVTTEDIAKLQTDLLKELSESIIKRNKYKHKARQEYIKNTLYYNERIKQAEKEYIRSHHDFFLDIMNDYKKYKAESKNNHYINFTKDESAKIQNIKKAISICVNLDAFKSFIKEEIKANREEIKKQLDI